MIDVVEKKEEQKINIPLLMETDNGIIILVTGENKETTSLKGVVIKSSTQDIFGRPLWNVGDYLDGWTRSALKPYEKEITIKNKP